LVKKWHKQVCLMSITFDFSATWEQIQKLFSNHFVISTVIERSSTLFLILFTLLIAYKVYRNTIDNSSKKQQLNWIICYLLSLIDEILDKRRSGKKTNEKNKNFYEWMRWIETDYDHAAYSMFFFTLKNSI
jgi:hypothetical protein